jgi:glycine dehydrogenase subunit 2
MAAILVEAAEDADKLKGAPYTMPVRRLDDVRAAKQLDLTWKPAVEAGGIGGAVA